jgi:peroxiredoxin/uncharacterized membrane protein YphA (DoxX/SURF4 family)
MNVVLFAARLVLSGVFAIAAVTKLADRAGTVQSAIDFGVPSSVARPFAWLLPLWELACAVALIPASTAQLAAMAAFATLLVFIGAIGVSLARGRTPDCHCFGQLHAKPVGWSTIARNLVLAGVAIFIVLQASSTGAEAASRAATIESSNVDSVTRVIAWLSLAFASFTLYLAFQLLRQNGRLLVRLEAIEARLGIIPGAERTPQGLPVDSPAPPFTAQDLDGASVTINPARDFDTMTLLVFVEPGCAACDPLLPDVARWQRDHADRLKTIVISRGTLGQNRNKSAKHRIRNVLIQTDRDAAKAYHVPGSPSGVLIVAGRIASPLFSGADPVRELAARSIQPGLRRGDIAPELELPNLAGEVVPFSTMNGRRTLVLFWNPTCGFCQQMLDDIKSWERHPVPGAPALVVVATGSPEATTQQGFRSPVLVDPEFKTAQLFGVSGTPSAVMLDERRRVASDVGVGAEAVLAMANSVLIPLGASM